MVSFSLKALSRDRASSSVGFCFGPLIKGNFEVLAFLNMSSAGQKPVELLRVAR